MNLSTIYKSWDKKSLNDLKLERISNFEKKLSTNV